jgi:methyltransferase-like protein/cyclopropane fatty-acyl-phospholipid synthase-like methyltransferase
MTELTRNSYDIVPYLDRSHHTSHPDRMATIAKLLGLEPAPVERARVLELGCANAGNLLPMADNLPGSTFVGVDFSARQIAKGQAAQAELGLENLTLRHASILDVDDSFGQFDYIIAHGVFSWVAPEVQDKMLAICRRNLSENGVAYISFNTLPGWYDKLYVRDLMLHYTRHITDPQGRIRRAREVFSQIENLVAPADTEQAVQPYAAALRKEADIVRVQDDDYIYHEYLEDDNRPMYVSDFANWARRHDLEYLGDADRGLTAIDALGAPVAEAIRQLNGDVVEQEQFLDYLANRTFRCALLVRKEAAINRSVTAPRLRPLFVRSPLQPEQAEPQLFKAEPESFRSEAHNTTIGVTQPVTKVALTHLSAVYPRAVAFDELLAEACQQVHGSLADHRAVRAREAESLGLNLLRMHVHNTDVVALHTYARCLAPVVPERPLASRIARFEALLSPNVTNAYHETISLNPLAWQLLPFVDGTRDLGSLVELVVGDATVILEQEGQAVRDPAARRAIAAERVPPVIDSLRRSALLVERTDDGR